MRKNRYLIQIKINRCQVLRLCAFFTLGILLLISSPKVFGQIAIPLQQGKFYREIRGSYYVGSDKGLWAVDKDTLKSNKIANVEGNVREIDESFERLYIATSKGVWVANKDGSQADKIANVQGFITSMFSDDESLYIGSDKGLWTIKKDNLSAKKIPGVNSVNFIYWTDNKNIYMEADNSFWALNTDGLAISRIAGIEGRISYAISNSERILLVANTGIWILHKGSLQATKVMEIDGVFKAIEYDDEHLYVATDRGVWIVDKDGSQAHKLSGFEGEAFRLYGNDEYLYIGTDQNLWIVNKKGLQVNKIPETIGEITKFGDIDGHLYLGTNRGLWTIERDGSQADKIPDVSGNINDYELKGEYLYIATDTGMWITNRNGSQARKVSGIDESIENITIDGNNIFIASSAKLYKLYPDLTITTQLVPSAWWSKIISPFVPSSWLPSEKVQAEAFYLDGKDKVPYSEKFPKEFRFASDSNETLPDDNKFSTQEQFTYEIGFGNNKAHYWVKDKWGNTFEQKAEYYGIPSQYIIAVLPFLLSAILILGCFALAPRIGFCHAAIMNPLLRKYFSLGSVPLLLSMFPALRRHILSRYLTSVNQDKELMEWKDRFIYPDEELLPENFGKKLEGERRLLLLGQSGIGKTSFFKHLTAIYASANKPPLPQKIFPVYISLANYGGNSLDDLVYNQLFSKGKITDKELAPMFLEQGGLLIFLDGVNEIQNVIDRQKLSEFVTKFWTSSYICLSSQQSYPEIENIPKVQVKAFSQEKICEFINERADDKENAQNIIKGMTDEDYNMYKVPRDLEFAIEILNSGGKSLPKSRTELYKTTFDSIFAKWKENGNENAEDNLCKHAYTMVVQRDLIFDSVENSLFKEITTDLYEQKFLLRREKSYNFRHDLIRSYLASEYFYPRWGNLFKEIKDKQIDSNWLEMLKFSCENLDDSNEVKYLIYEILERSIRKDLVRNLFEWLRDNHPNKCQSWEKDFYTKYGELDFKQVILPQTVAPEYLSDNL